MTKTKLERTRCWLPCLALGMAVCVPILAIACGEDNTATPECPDLPLFNIRELIDGSLEASADYAAWQKAATGTDPCVTGAGTAVIQEAGVTSD